MIKVKLSCFSYPLQCFITHISFFLQLRSRTSPLEISTSIKALLSMGVSQKQCFPGTPSYGQEDLEPVHGSLQGPHLVLRSVCLLPDALVGETP